MRIPPPSRMTVLEPICAGGPLKEAIENLAGAIQESGARITVSEMPSVRIRQSHLAQVFQNLVGNVIKYRKRAHYMSTFLPEERITTGCSASRITA